MKMSVKVSTLFASILVFSKIRDANLVASRATSQVPSSAMLWSLLQVFLIFKMARLGVVETSFFFSYFHFTSYAFW